MRKSEIAERVGDVGFDISFCFMLWEVMEMEFLIGLTCFGIGTVFGIVLMCLLQINRISGGED